MPFPVYVLINLAVRDYVAEAITPESAEQVSSLAALSPRRGFYMNTHTWTRKEGNNLSSESHSSFGLYMNIYVSTRTETNGLSSERHSSFFLESGLWPFRLSLS